MNHKSQVGIAVSTDELVEFLKQCSSQTRMLIRKMSINAVDKFRLPSSSVGDRTFLYFEAEWNEKMSPEITEIMIWVRDLTSQNKMVYFLKLERSGFDREVHCTSKYGSLGFRLRQTIDIDTTPPCQPKGQDETLEKHDT